MWDTTLSSHDLSQISIVCCMLPYLDSRRPIWEMLWGKQLQHLKLVIVKISRDHYFIIHRVPYCFTALPLWLSLGCCNTVISTLGINKMLTSFILTHRKERVECFQWREQRAQRDVEGQGCSEVCCTSQWTLTPNSRVSIMRKGQPSASIREACRLLIMWNTFLRYI